MALGMNYSTAGFELILSRKMSFYIITYYLPSGLFVGISWVSFLINPEVIPGIECRLWRNADWGSNADWRCRLGSNAPGDRMQTLVECRPGG